MRHLPLIATVLVAGGLAACDLDTAGSGQEDEILIEDRGIFEQDRQQQGLEQDLQMPEEADEPAQPGMPDAGEGDQTGMGIEGGNE